MQPYQRFTGLGCKYIWIRKFEFVAKTWFLFGLSKRYCKEKMKGGIGWSRRKSRDNDTALSLAEVLVTQYGLYGQSVIILSILSRLKMQNEKKYNYNKSKPKILRLLRDIVVFRLVAYLLIMICLILQLFFTKMHIHEFLYKFDTVLYQFLETGTSNKCLIGIVQLLRFSGFRLYPFHFSFTVSLMRLKKSLQEYGSYYF